MLYSTLQASGQHEHMIIQDLALPYDTAAEFAQSIHESLNIYPLWLNPLKQSPLPTMHPHSNQYEVDGTTLKPLLNIGLWGSAPTNHGKFVSANQFIERVLRELGGMKWLYAQTYSSEEDFWQDFDKPWYDALRSKYHADTLPTVYEKVKVDVEAERRASETRPWSERLLHRWPFAGLYGIKKATDSGDFAMLAGCLLVMCTTVIALNRTIWHQLYSIAENRFKYDR